MLADWRGSGRTFGKPDTRAWYEANRDKMLLHPETRLWVELELGIPQTEIEHIWEQIQQVTARFLEEMAQRFNVYPN